MALEQGEGLLDFSELDPNACMGLGSGGANCECIDPGSLDTVLGGDMRVGSCLGLIADEMGSH